MVKEIMLFVCCRHILQVSYPPYLFEAFLYAAVDDLHGKATVGNGVVIFQFDKKEAVLWHQPQCPQAQDKEFQKQKREEALKRAHSRAQEEKDRRAKEKREDDRLSVREQIKVSGAIASVLSVVIIMIKLKRRSLAIIQQRPSSDIWMTGNIWIFEYLDI